MKTLYITADQVGQISGGGIVTQNEITALSRIGSVTVLGQKELGLNPDPFAYDRTTAERVKNLLTVNSYDLAHFYAGCFTETIRLLKQNGVFVSYTAAAHDVRLSKEEHERLGIPFNYPHLVEPDLWEQYLGGYREADLIICPSNLSKRIMESYGCRSVTVIPHGVDLPGEVKPPPKRFDVGYLGQPGPDKGLIYLLHAWKMLGWKDSTLRIAGRGTEELIPLIRAHGGGNIYLMGFIENKRDLYDSIHVYAQPSVTEGFGIEILEAIANQKYVIASEGAGASELIDEACSGDIVPIRDPKAIAEKFEAAKKRYKHYEANALQDLTDYTWDNVHKLYAEIWSNALQLTI